MEKSKFILTLFYVLVTIIGTNAIKLSRRGYGDVVGGKDYRIVSQKSGKYLTVVKNGVQQWSRQENGDAQTFRFQDAGNGRFAILSGQLALTVENGNRENGNLIILTDYRKTAAQHFILHKTDDSLESYYITAECSGNAAFDILDQSFDDGAILDQWDYWGGDNQKFYIIPVDQDTSYITEVPDGLYLFAFFQGNAPEKEQLSYALSTDGYHFNILNYGRSIWKSNVGTGCIRDPFIIKSHDDDSYYLLATDMRSYSGWDSNRNILTAHSKDLITWEDITVIEIANKYPNTQRADRAWAPQAIYDPEKQSYMIYFAVRTPGNGNKTIMYHAYSKDFKKLDTAVELLFAPRNGNEAIDSDIIYQNNKYYMYYKDETRKTINLATADHASGPYQEIKQLSSNGQEVEGCNIYKVGGTNKWLMMSDDYINGYFVLQETTDLVNFKTVDRRNYSFNFTPRHGYVIPINVSQYNALLKAYPADGVRPIYDANEAAKQEPKQEEIHEENQENNTSGYPYCKTTTTVVYVDDLEWGVENNDWCIIKNQSASCDCWSEKMGFPCCNDMTVYYEDSDGQWGVKDGEWCGIRKC